MGLYLCIFDGSDEIDGIDVGSYEDFSAFRETVFTSLEEPERGAWGSRFPMLQLHSDCDGEWTASECVALREELLTIRKAFSALPPLSNGFASDWQQQLASEEHLCPASLVDSFIDVDGTPLIDRLIALCDCAIASQQPILFQ